MGHRLLAVVGIGIGAPARMKASGQKTYQLSLTPRQKCCATLFWATLGFIRLSIVILTHSYMSCLSSAVSG